MKKNKYVALVLAGICACIMGGCGSDASPKIYGGRDVPYIPTTEREEESSGEEDYDIRDLAMVLRVDTENMQIVLRSLQDGEKYLLTYSGACDVTDKYGDIMAMSRINKGEIVDAYYRNESSELVRLNISSEAFSKTQVTDFTCDEAENVFAVKGEKYLFDETLLVMSQGREIALSEIADVDVLTVRGVGKYIYSIDVTAGHGYIKIDKADYFEGGILEIGSKMMLLITKDMRITAPEGTYKVTATIDGNGGSKEVTVNRGEEIRLSLTELQGEAVRYGSYSFEIVPEDAVLQIDGKETNYEGLVNLTYGSHKIQVTADGYDSYSATIVVDSVFESLTIDLEQTEEEKDTEKKEKDDYLIYIDAPQDAEVYFDGVYKGVAPVSFEKSSGTHIITLRCTGYETKMYTLEISSKEEDVHFVLPDMLKVE